MKSTICSDENKKKYKNLTLDLIKESDNIINSFKKEPQSSPGKTRASEVPINVRILNKRHELEELFLNLQKRIIILNKTRTGVSETLEKLDVKLDLLHNHKNLNQKNINKRDMRAKNEKKIIDCPEDLLKVEKKKLKEFEILLNDRKKILNLKQQNLNLWHHRFNQFKEYLLNKKSIFSKRVPRESHTFLLIAANCPDAKNKMPLTKMETEMIIASFFDLLCSINKAEEETKKLKMDIDKESKEMWFNKEKLFKMINKALKNKVKELDELIKKLGEADWKAQDAINHFTKMAEETKTVLFFSPNCEHMKKYYEETMKNLAKLKENLRKIIIENKEKCEARAIDLETIAIREAEESNIK